MRINLQSTLNRLLSTNNHVILCNTVLMFKKIWFTTSTMRNVLKVESSTLDERNLNSCFPSMEEL